MVDLWTVDALVLATGGDLVGATGKMINHISIDSREMGDHGLFVAIKGDRFDGHDFIDAAFANGAALALVSRDKVAGKSFAGPLLIVEDALEGLCAIARAARARTSAKIIAVTGSVGKTSTKEALRMAFEQVGATHASIRSFNNHWGVPLMLARMPIETEFGIFEIGMNHPGEIVPLTAMVRPDIAIITNVGAVHLEFFDNVQAIADAKAEIFTGMGKEGIALLGSDHDFVDYLRNKAVAAGLDRVASFGQARNSDVRPLELSQNGEASSGFVDVMGQTVDFTLSIPGLHNVRNMLGVLACAKLLDVDLAQILPTFGQMSAPEGRGSLTRMGVAPNQILLVDESFNANPTSMRAALNVMALRRPDAGGAKIFVLGDMLELGQEGPTLHLDLVQAVIEAEPDVVHCVGPLMEQVYQGLPERMRGLYGKSLENIAKSVMKSLKAHDLIMVKGSKGTGLSALIVEISCEFGAPTGD